ncbi:MAG: hypothetical protein ACI4OP_04365 [Candidatus Coprovivens sp.]
MRRKGLLRKAIYLVLFIALGVCFVLISEKYKDNSKPDIIEISDYYEGLNDKQYTVIGGGKFINLLENDGKHLVVIGNHKSEWSKYYVEELDKVIEVSDIKNVYHYDINNDKAQLNSNYYAIVNLLKGSLVTTDGTDSNLLAPSFYIIKDGKVLYYNTDTVAMKNTEKPSKYWTEEKKQEFNAGITNAINKYYLNNK